jgi:hypothetical protein
MFCFVAPMRIIHTPFYLFLLKRAGGEYFLYILRSAAGALRGATRQIVRKESK